jgi:hypothetical protein
MYEDPGKLTEDNAQGVEWTSDEKIWKDVYSQKPVEYLEAISKGLDPVWDNELKKYTYDDPNNKTNSTVDMSSSSNTVDPQANEKVDEDLPF